MSKQKVLTYKIPDGLKQRERIHKLMNVIDDLKDASFHLDLFMEKVAKKNGTFDDLLEAILDFQANSSEDRRINRWQKNANFTLGGVSLNSFDYSHPRTFDRTLLNELRSFRFVEENKNVLIIGPSGVGKTYIASALGHEAIERGVETRCMTLGDIVKEVNATMDSRKGRDQKIATLVRVKLLILDDIEETEKLGNFTTDATDFLYTIMRKRYESNDSSTILTFNNSFNGWDKIFGSHARAQKLIDRIVERHYALKIEGESYREKLGKEGSKLNINDKEEFVN